VLVVGVERVGLVHVRLGGAGLDGRSGLGWDHGHAHMLAVGGHHVGRDGQRLLQLRGEVAGLGANGHVF